MAFLLAMGIKRILLAVVVIGALLLLSKGSI
jgi:hypothetical protein